MSQAITNYTLSAQNYTLKQEERLDQEKERNLVVCGKEAK